MPQNKFSNPQKELPLVALLKIENVSFSSIRLSILPGARAFRIDEN
jgi:hypothetical protein